MHAFFQAIYSCNLIDKHFYLKISDPFFYKSLISINVFRTQFESNLLLSGCARAVMVRRGWDGVGEGWWRRAYVQVFALRQRFDSHF